MVSPGALLAGLLALAVLAAWARLAWRQARADVPAAPWRLALLLLLQPVCAALLYLTLVPPATGGGAGTLVVATANAPRLSRADVALPEAPPVAGAERVPDLATALRRRPGTASLRIVGDGLEARDRDVARGLALAFAATPPRPGIVALEPPAPVAPGAAFAITGRVAGTEGGSVDLLDPAGDRVDRQPLAPNGTFRLTGAARAASPALFRLRVRGPGNAVVEEADMPVPATDGAAARLLLLAGAASPEVKYLRRWAADAGLTVSARVTAGGGAALGDAPVSVDAASLQRFDVAVIDERSWATLGAGACTALVSSVRNGLGLVVRLTGPVPDATRAQWRALGVATPSGNATAPAPMASGLPILTRRPLAAGPSTVPLWRDGRGQTLADWRAVGRGRVALWSVVDGFTLVLTGHADRYGRAWSDAIAVVARSGGSPRPSLPALPRAGERMSLCGIGTAARITGPDAATLLADPASGGCAGYWPRLAGWHLLADRVSTPFYVYPAKALPALRTAERAAATAPLRREHADRPATGAAEHGTSWPWFLLLLAALTGLWWLERARYGRVASKG